jgi:transcriptional regulator with XRE-family HTH domain
VNEFNRWLQMEMDKRNYNQRDLARISGLSPGSIGNVLRGDRKPDIDFCTHIAHALRIPVIVVLRKAGLVPQETPSNDLIEEFLYELNNMGYEDLEGALEVIRTMRRISERRSSYKTNDRRPT